MGMDVMNDLKLSYLLVVVYNLTILGGAAYLITMHDWSNWTMLLAIILLGSFSTKDDKEESKE